MILAADIGNTNISLGVFNAGVLISRYRVGVLQFRPDNAKLQDYLNKVTDGQIENIVVASVNPAAGDIFYQWALDRCRKEPLVIGRDIQPRMATKVKAPGAVGVDRIVNAAAGYKLAGSGVVVVDLGTAITFDVVSDSGEFLGGVISPGMTMCADALCRQTRQLPLIDADRVDAAIGEDTKEAMMVGIYWGVVGAIITILERLFAELRYRPHVIATGGDAEAVKEDVPHIDQVVPYLTLDGIRLVYEDGVRAGSRG